MKTMIVLICMLALLAKNASAEESGQTENLSALIAAAIANNPELKSSRARWQMFAGKARQAGSLEDPMVMFKVQNLLVREPFSVGGKDPATARVIGISQQIPFWGKRALREEVAGYEAEAYRWAVEERKLELRRMVQEVYYRLYAVDRGLDVVEKNIRTITDFTMVAEQRYSLGQGGQQDIFKAGLESSKMHEMRISLLQQRRNLEANLNYLLFRPSGTPVGRVAEFEPPVVTLAPEKLNELAYEQRPQLKNAVSLAGKAMAGRRLAQKELWPDFNLSFEYMFRSQVASEMATDPGYDMFTVGVTFNFPLQQERRRAMLAESSSETDMAQEELNGLKNSISYAITDSLAQMERRAKLIELYRSGIIPQAEQSLESALIGYRVGKVDFLTLLDGSVSLFNYERELYESKAEYMMAMARLEAAVGMELTSAAKAEDQR